jgi:CRP/FNR family cyclic AMP-dependent transcriptional regulator
MREARQDPHADVLTDAPLHGAERIDLGWEGAARAGTAAGASAAPFPQARSQDRRPGGNASQATARPAAAQAAQNTGAARTRPDACGTVALARFDPDLLDAASEAQRDQAGRTLLARAYRFASGPIDLTAVAWPDTTFALLLLRGGLAHDTRAGTGRMIAFLASGDVLMPFSPDPHETCGRVSVTASEEVLLAALDHQFVRAAAVWPKLMVIIQRRLCEQQHRLAVHGAICQLPRVEQRLMALMWHLADRFGKVTADGILMPLPLTHQALADLIGARRPTVSLAVKALREQERLSRRPDGAWLLQQPTRVLGSLQDLTDALNAQRPPRYGGVRDQPEAPAQAMKDTAVS